MYLVKLELSAQVESRPISMRVVTNLELLSQADTKKTPVLNDHKLYVACIGAL